MPTYKPELTQREQAKYLSIARELEAAGTRVDIPDEWQENARLLRITIAGSPESLIIQLSPSIVLYIFRVISGRTWRNPSRIRGRYTLGPGRLSLLPRGTHSVSIRPWTRF